MNKDLTDPKDPIEDKEMPDMSEDNNDEIDENMLDESIELVIEIDDVENFLKLELDSDDIEEIDSKSEDDIEVIEEDVDFSKHKIQGKHSLKYDSIFKGKKEDPLTDEEFETTATYYNESFEVDKGSIYWFESIDNENYVKQKKVQEKVYEVLINHTELNFLNNRRKPSKSDFNNYYFFT